ncbi:MAG: tetratricopeptide repeat protein [Opitutales bacterium]
MPFVRNMLALATLLGGVHTAALTPALLAELRPPVGNDLAAVRQAELISQEPPTFSSDLELTEFSLSADEGGESGPLAEAGPSSASAAAAPSGKTTSEEAASGESGAPSEVSAADATAPAAAEGGGLGELLAEGSSFTAGEALDRAHAGEGQAPAAHLEETNEGLAPPSRDAFMSEEEAEIALRYGDHAKAAEIYARISAQSHDAERRKDAMLRLVEVYRQVNDAMRMVSILERYKREFPDDRRIPEVHLRLGYLYRELSAPQQAVDAFFAVLKQSFRLTHEDLRVYREITNEASYQIAETYYRMHQYELAAEFFSRLLRSARPNTPERLDLVTKSAYANYFSGDYRKVLHLLEMRGWGRMDPSRQAEFRFLRASSFWALKDKESAHAEIVNLANLEVRPNQDPYWNFWWKFVGNELANDLFEADQFATAHKLYFSLLHLSKEPPWQLPIIFQIGRCRESAGDFGEAERIYREILAQIDADDSRTAEGNLLVLRSRVEDQVKNLQWQRELARAREQHGPSPAHDSSGQSLASAYARGG